MKKIIALVISMLIVTSSVVVAFAEEEDWTGRPISELSENIQMMLYNAENDTDPRRPLGPPCNDCDASTTPVVGQIAGYCTDCPDTVYWTGFSCYPCGYYYDAVFFHKCSCGCDLSNW